MEFQIVFLSRFRAELTVDGNYLLTADRAASGDAIAALADAFIALSRVAQERRGISFRDGETRELLWLCRCGDVLTMQVRGECESEGQNEAAAPIAFETQADFYEAAAGFATALGRFEQGGAAEVYALQWGEFPFSEWHCLQKLKRE